MTSTLEAWIGAGAPNPLEDLRAYGPRFDVADGYDRSYNRLRDATIGGVDPHDPAHATALLHWLRSWGCRHLRRLDTKTVTIPALQAWAVEWLPQLPGPAEHLVDLGAEPLDAIGSAFGSLAERMGARRTYRGSELPVRFGATAAAKALFAIRPLACPPWDEPIRVAFRFAGSAEGYAAYLALVRERLLTLSSETGVAVPDLPAFLGRPNSSPPKLIDEYLWARISRGL